MYLCFCSAKVAFAGWQSGFLLASISVCIGLLLYWGFSLDDKRVRQVICSLTKWFRFVLSHVDRPDILKDTRAACVGRAESSRGAKVQLFLSVGHLANPVVHLRSHGDAQIIYNKLSWARRLKSPPHWRGRRDVLEERHVDVKRSTRVELASSDLVFLRYNQAGRDAKESENARKVSNIAVRISLADKGIKKCKWQGKNYKKYI